MGDSGSIHVCIYMNYWMVRIRIKGGFWIHTRVYLHELQILRRRIKGGFLIHTRVYVHELVVGA